MIPLRCLLFNQSDSPLSFHESVRNIPTSMKIFHLIANLATAASIAILAAAAVSPLAMAQTMTGANPVKIFILAGESNMHGKGTVSPSTTQGTLDYITLPANDPTGKYQFLKSGGSYVTRADVGIRGLVYSGAPNPGNLTINYGGLATGLIGPELGFGHVIGDAYENKVLLVKVGVDGTTLAGSFCPPSSRIGDPEPVTSADKGFYYKEIIRLVNEAKTSLGATPHEIAGLGWHQGWNDRVQAAMSAAYETNMRNFINDIRVDLATPNMPVVIASAAMDAGTGYSEVEKAQLKMADATAYPAFAGNVAVVDTRKNYDDLEFWQSVAKSPADEGYHWNRNGMTYLHIGMAMGDAMALIASNRIPCRLRASGGSSGTTLSWKNGTEMPTSVRVLRNGVEIAAAAPVNPPTFVDTAAPVGISSYELQFTMPGNPALPLTVSHNSGIIGLQASDRINGIKLTWQNNLTYTAILVKRNGTTIAASLPGDTTTFVDNTPVPGAATYTVEPTDPGSTPASVQITVSAAPRGTAVIYEPFDMTAATTLNDKPGGIGLDGNWVAGTDVQVTAGSFTFGTLPTFGNRIVRTTSNGTVSITVGPSLAEAGLLDDGAQLWFSFLCPHPNNINVSPNLVFGTDALSSSTSVGNSGNAIGVRINQGTAVQAITCVGGGIVATSATQATLANSEVALIVGKITWGATPAAVDTIEIYTPGTNLALDTPQSATAVLDQSTFNVISSWGNGTAPNIDEIRFGATYADVIGQGVDTSGDLTAPTPSPMSFATPPTAVLDSAITMTATTANDTNGVQYRFHNTTRNTYSAWQDSPAFTDTGLAANTSYSYTVQARDKSVNQNTNNASPPQSATTLEPDTSAPPTPGFANPPTAVSATAITMTSTVVADPEGAPVQYRFHNTTLGTNSGWQTSTTYNFTGLIPSTTYSFTVQARDTASVPNESAHSAPLSATTNGPTNGTWAFDSDGTWSDSAKWTGNLIAVGSGATASFTSNITANRIISLDTPRTIGNITFTDSTTSSNDLTIAGANTLTLDVPSGLPVIDVTQSGRSLIISSVITGTKGLQKNGAGRLALTSTNTYSGTTSVTGGMLDLGSVSLAGVGGGNGRNISVSSGAAVRRDALNNTFLNRLVETSDEITVMSGGTSNNLDFSSSTGANLPKAFLGNWAGNGAKMEYTGTITPAADAYRIGGRGSNGLLGIRSVLSGARGLMVGGTGGSGIRVNLVAANTFTGNTVINTGARLSLGNNLALQNSALDVGSAGGNFSCAAGTNGGRITGETAAASPTFGGLIGSRNLLTVFSNSAGNNETNLASTAVTGFTLNPGSGKTCAYSGTIANFATGTTITKTGDGTQIFSGANSYTGATAVNGGKLFINGNQSTASGTVTVAANATIGGSGTIGGDVAIANHGSLEFHLSSPPGNHDKLELAVGKSLSFGANATLTITSTSGATTGTYTLLTAPGGIGALPAFTVNLPAGWSASPPAKSGNDLVLTITSTSPYGSWAAAKGLGALNNAKADDPDQDGKNNLQEFAFDGNPLSGTNDGKVVGRISTIAGNQVLTLTLPVREGAAFGPDSGDLVSAPIDGVIYRIEGDKSLGPFDDSITEVTGTDAATIQTGLPALNGGWIYRTFRSPDTVPTAPKAFLRAKVSE